MSALRRILGATLLAAGVTLLFSALFLANQRFHFVDVAWGVFDIRIGDMPVENSAGAAICAGGSLVMLILGLKLLHRRGRSAS